MRPPRAGDRVLAPVRGTVLHRRGGRVAVLADRDRELIGPGVTADDLARRYRPERVALAVREAVCVCDGCGMWRHRHHPCRACEVME